LWLADRLRLSKGGFCYWWRSHLDPAWNHHVQKPVRFWSREGTDKDVLCALAERRFADLPGGRHPRPLAGSSSLLSWTRRSATCVLSKLPTGIATGGGSIAGPAGIPRTIYGKQSMLTSTCAAQPNPGQA
jgi:hypothetical protein